MADVRRMENSGKWVGAGGWKMDDGPDAMCYAVLCRRVDETEFAWRYIVWLEVGDLILDTIPQLLDWYKDFHVESLDYVRDHASEEFLFML
jgi:hypothetical protein